MSNKEDARVWLRANGYDDIAEKIDEIMTEWKRDGKKTRRNWWDILSGDKNGNPRVVSGFSFPVLRTAQLRQGKNVTKSSVSKGIRENRQIKRSQTRWKHREVMGDDSDGKK